MLLDREIAERLGWKPVYHARACAEDENWWGLTGPLPHGYDIWASDTEEDAWDRAVPRFTEDIDLCFRAFDYIKAKVLKKPWILPLIAFDDVAVARKVTIRFDGKDYVGKDYDRTVAFAKAIHALLQEN